MKIIVPISLILHMEITSKKVNNQCFFFKFLSKFTYVILLCPKQTWLMRSILQETMDLTGDWADCEELVGVT